MVSKNRAQDAPIAIEDDMSEGSITLDFSSVGGNEPLPDDAPYLCMVTKFEPGKSRQGQGKIDVEYTVSEPEEYANRKLFRTYSLQPQALFALRDTLQALGEDPKSLSDKAFQVVPDAYIGRSCVVYIQNETYNERINSRPRRVAHADTWTEATAF